MRHINEIITYGTTDGHKFYNLDNAKEWQANLDYSEYLVYRHDRDCDKVTLVLNNKKELNILLEYLQYYLNFKSIYADYSGLEYPVKAIYYVNSKRFELGE